MIIIELAGTPKGKQRPRGFARTFVDKATGRTVTRAAFYPDAKTKTYELQIRDAGVRAMCGAAPLEGPLSVDMEVRFPLLQSWSKKDTAAALEGRLRPTKKPDADNLLKIIDGLNHIIWIDDAQVVDARVRKVYSERPGITILVEELITVDRLVPRVTEEMELAV